MPSLALAPLCAASHLCAPLPLVVVYIVPCRQLLSAVPAAVVPAHAPIALALLLLLLLVLLHLAAARAPFVLVAVRRPAIAAGKGVKRRVLDGGRGETETLGNM